MVELADEELYYATEKKKKKKLKRYPSVY